LDQSRDLVLENGDLDSSRPGQRGRFGEYLGRCMTWQLVRIEDRAARDDRPFISISVHRITFGAVFARVAELDTRHRVSILVDQYSFRLCFEFHTEERPHSLALVADNKTKTRKHSGLFCSSHGLLKQYPWVKAVAKLPSVERRFQPKRESKMWVIELCPSFEQRFARESANIPSDAVGIYRYVRENGEVVYIGRGNIRKRLAAPERSDWDFDVIEYSIVEDPDQQLRWETYWIDKFQEVNAKLPFYNRVAGQRVDESPDA